MTLRSLLLGGLLAAGSLFTTPANIYSDLESQDTQPTMKLLEEYISINTSYPTCNYDKALQLFKHTAESDGFTTHQLDLPSGYKALIITLTGTDPSLPALGLNHHMDVVPALQKDGWHADPSSLFRTGLLLVGRGTQDMKGVGVVHYAALRELKKHNPKRTVHMLIVPDEERGGFKGTKELVETQAFANLHLGFMLDEGMPSGQPTKLLIKVGERTPVQIRVSVTGNTAHGSALRAENPIHKLLGFLHALCTKHEQQQKKALKTDPGLCISYQITSLQAGDPQVLNCIPASAQATIDIRVPPTHDCSVILKELNGLCTKHPGVTYNVVATSKERMPLTSTKTFFYKTLAKTIKQAGLTPTPFNFEATTDSRFYANKGIETLGLTPFTVTPNLHGINEAILIRDLDHGKQIFTDFLKAFC